jgi:hypothetical protein
MWVVYLLFHFDRHNFTDGFSRMTVTARPTFEPLGLPVITDEQARERTIRNYTEYAWYWVSMFKWMFGVQLEMLVTASAIDLAVGISRQIRLLCTSVPRDSMMTMLLDSLIVRFLYLVFVADRGMWRTIARDMELIDDPDEFDPVYVAAAVAALRKHRGAAPAASRFA